MNVEEEIFELCTKHELLQTLLFGIYKHLDPDTREMVQSSFADEGKDALKKYEKYAQPRVAQRAYNDLLQQMQEIDCELSVSAP